ncbi:DNA packaging terminase subunit 1 [Spheniscid alphaherpesvirus 1]|uniref:DNA packaging terminase subunit 1 n=1 Tax=Spheniscid alphaherpesvirus 1 TaxID=2560777 RepID=A0A1R3T468_9ALPH|nr:DNA packaging terminase subunit 1 [Spheniscid alphaherpesvirus 1]SCO83577.1 DNA packaging terminase subunit 1 [Spheniscid alphaherpesvirus 1]
MFGSKLGEETKQYFEELRRKRDERLGARDQSRIDRSDDDIRTPFLNFATSVPRRHQTVIPAVGTLHDCCETAPLFSAVARHLLFSSLVPKQWNVGCNETKYPPIREAYLAPELSAAVDDLNFAEYDEEDAAAHRNSYYSVMNAFSAMRDSDAFGQLSSFVGKFGKLLTTGFQDTGDHEIAKNKTKRAKLDVPSYDKTRGTLELFQKMILMHATYFLASVILGDHAEKVASFLRVAFDTPLFTDTATKHFRQRATVFLVPRRHGKTWFLVPLIALAMATFKGIKVGYTAHIRKATEPVFEEIGARLRRWFGQGRVEHVKGETISFSFPDGSRSTIVFASSHNTNGLRGQDFNLLFVDEANFIRPDAVQTIVGFLNQTNCKIIFVSSTNTGKASTSFLYNIKGTSDELLNVVTYICDEHMQRVVTHTNATACSCYVLNKPVFITMDGAMRQTAELFLADSFMQEIIGGGEIGGRGGQLCNQPVFTNSALDRFVLYRPSTVSNQTILSRDLYVYVDPAFTANTRASGTGVAVIGRYMSDYVIFGLEHFFLRALTGCSAEAIGRCVVQCLAQIYALHKQAFGKVYITIEGNSSQDSAVAIARRVNFEMAMLAESGCVSTPKSVLFYHCIPPGSDVAYPFFLLNKQKTEACDYFIQRFNSGCVLASQELVSTTIRLCKDPVDYLTNQMKNLTEVTSGPSETRVFTGKKGGSADDTLVALILAIYVSMSTTDTDFAPLTRN